MSTNTEYWKNCFVDNVQAENILHQVLVETDVCCLIKVSDVRLQTRYWILFLSITSFICSNDSLFSRLQKDDNFCNIQLCFKSWIPNRRNIRSSIYIIQKYLFWRSHQSCFSLAYYRSECIDKVENTKSIP